MENELEFLGILFRSRSHLHWFLGSVTMFTITVGSLAWCLKARPEADKARLLTIFWFLALIFHLGAFVAASMNYYDKVVILNQNPNGRLFSTDCIWFNAMWIGIYAIILVFFHRWKKRVYRPVRNEPTEVADSLTL